VSDLSAEVLFPTQGAIDEAQQIGRGDTIEALTGRGLDHSDALLLEPRKVGKTSVVRAALERVRTDQGGVVADVDCTGAGVSSGPTLARVLLRALRDGGGDVSRRLSARETATRGRRVRDRLRATSDAAAQFGVGEAKAAGRLLDLLEVEAPSLDEVLAEIARLGTETTTVIFLDEIQAITGWADRSEVEQALRRFLRHDGRRVALIAAGSDRDAAQALFAEGRPLEWEFEPFNVPDIDPVDWHQGIVERFERAGLKISAARVDQIIAETGGRPWKTMLVAKKALRETREAREGEVSVVAVDAAIAEAREHPSWDT
jgi:hypothetical protein